MVDKLKVDFKNDINFKSPIYRRYTLTHSDTTGQRFLMIGEKYAHERYNKLRDEVIGKWSKNNREYELHLMCNLYSEFSTLTIKERYEKFKEHMPRVIIAIINGDVEYLKKNMLLDCNVYIHFIDGVRNLKEDYGKINNYVKCEKGTSEVKKQ